MRNRVINRGPVPGLSLHHTTEDLKGQLRKGREGIMPVKVLVAQLCLIRCDPMDCSPPGSSVGGILQARILEWVVIPFSGGSSRPGDGTWVCCIVGRFFTVWATRGAPFCPRSLINMDTNILKLYCELGQPQSQRQTASWGWWLPFPEKLPPALRALAGAGSTQWPWASDLQLLLHC